VTALGHQSVLLQQTVEAVVPYECLGSSGVYVDGTFGRGGHARLLLQRLGERAKLYVIDKDPQALEVAQQLASEDPRVVCLHGGFGDLQQLMAECGEVAIDGLMLDLGVSSPQLDEAQRGFSFMRDGPLDMRMDTSQGRTVAQWLADAELDEIREVVKDYGEERFALQVAKAIVARRAVRPIERTLELADIIAAAVRTREKGQHPATRTFQALRIYINRELEELDCALEAALVLLKAGGRLAVISFHSLEDRKVKQFLQVHSRVPAELQRLPLREDQLPSPLFARLQRIKPHVQEIQANPRARSAVLRCAVRTDAALSGRVR
jgi:16S rRNA (cytosine1402-N4)-methyltransferase